ncbi:MAG: hypothetical protein M1814_003923 [Vezdaea aestivalis]|nr:MAG: hypothetical protein M1814_003923 [Vezdaea aestivalis]
MRHSLIYQQPVSAALSLLALTQVTHCFPFTPSTLIKRADNWPVKTGYVAFGDSYGAGMGTGTTSLDVCRVGSNSFSNLLNTAFNKPDIDFQRRVCSGDTTVGLNRQIDEWTNPKKADLATVSIGGNDVGFSNLTWHCIMTPNFLDDDSKAKCETAKNVARKLMDDPGESGLRSKLSKAYKRILDKSGRDDFHVYVTSYIAFFNQDDNDCDKSTFYFWEPRYDDKPNHQSSLVYLEKPIRKEFNDLVGKLNDVIKGAVDDANRDHGKNQVHAVDVNGRFDKHRWCEAGDFHEPDESRRDTFFFLSGWRDYSVGSLGVFDTVSEVTLDAQEAAQEQSEVKALIGQKSIQLPNGADCSSKLGTDPDPWAIWQCQAAEAIRAHPNGVVAQNLKAANDEIKNGGVNAQHINKFIPTRQIKTFHPRTAGMYQYRDAVLDAIRSAQPGGGGGDSSPPLAKTCNGLGSKNYVAQQSLSLNIDDFCGQAAKQGTLDKDSGSIGRKFFAGTPNEVDISMDWTPGLDFKPNQADCIAILNHISDDCDGNDPNNPMNWKGGGKIVNGKVTYNITPKALRQPLPNKPGGTCSDGYKVFFDQFYITGTGYSGSLFGQEEGGLLERLRVCGVVTDWTFTYGLDKDGREWTAEGKLPIWKSSCVAWAVGAAGGPNIGC